MYKLCLMKQNSFFKKISIKPLTYILILWVIGIFSPLFAASDSIRAQLPELRECVRKEPGTNWKSCKGNCYDICNEIQCDYDRGLCNGALIQLCCGEHPSDCK